MSLIFITMVTGLRISERSDEAGIDTLRFKVAIVLNSGILTLLSFEKGAAEKRCCSERSVHDEGMVTLLTPMTIL